MKKLRRTKRHRWLAKRPQLVPLAVMVKLRRRILDEDGGVATVLSAFHPHHGLAQRLVDVERRAVQFVAGFELAIHFVRKVMEAGMEIIFIAYDDDIIGS
jgi:hypothetical protein